MLLYSQRFLGFLILLGTGIIGQAFQNNTKINCNCEVTVQWYQFNINTPYIKCRYIDTMEKVNCARQFITSKGQNISKVEIHDSDMKLFTNNFNLPAKVKEIDISDCKIAGEQKRLFQSICKSLSVIRVNNCEMKNKTIRAEVFENCKNIRQISITQSGIVTVSKNAFSVLHNLRRLELYLNKMQSFEGFKGIENLEWLHLTLNNISIIDKNAFQGLEKLTVLDLNYNQLNTLEESVFQRLNKLTHLSLSYNQLSTLEDGVFQGLEKLSYLDLSYNRLSTLEAGVFDPFKHNQDIRIFLFGNNFHCDCSLKWLQDSLWKSEWFTSDTFGSWDEPQCLSPIYGSLKNITFCNLINRTSGQSSYSPMWPIGLLLSTCILAVASTSTVFTV